MGASIPKHAWMRLSIPTPRRTAVAQAVALAVVSAIAAGCGGVRVSPLATSAPESAPGPAAVTPVAAQWTEGTVEQPGDVGSSAQTSGIFCSPCHASQETSLAAVAVRDGTFVGVGIQFPPPTAAAWFSTDAIHWQRAPGLAAPEGSVMSAVAAVPDGFVAVGSVGPHAAAWTSADGRRWVSSTVPDAAPGAARIRAVVAGRFGIVAAGEIAGPSGPRPAAWASRDGVTWASVDVPSEAGSVAGLAADGSRIVAVGTVTAGAVTRAATWSSADGRTWALGAEDPSMGDADMRAVAAGGPGFVAVGTTQGGTRAAAWSSTDGAHWRPDTDGGPAFTNYGQRIAMDAVVAGARGFVAVGKRDSAGNGSGVVWVSPDGRSWTQVPSAASFDGAEIVAVTVSGGLVVGAGAIGLPDQWTASTWVTRDPPS